MGQGDLFKQNGDKLRRKNKIAPLSDRMRPKSLADVVGQHHILGEGGVLASVIKNDQIPSLIFWGPPGCGKTTIAKVIAEETKSHFETISAVMAGVGDLKRIFKKAEEQLNLYSQRTILFVDEIHRFNKAQQDALLPHVESGNVILIGATTENPSFAVISALLSRTSVLELKPLSEDDIFKLLERATKDKENGLG